MNERYPEILSAPQVTSDGAMGACDLRMHDLTDSTQQAAAQPWVTGEIHQVSPGRYRGTCTSLSIDGMHVARDHQNRIVHKVGITPPNTCTVSMSCMADPAFRFSQFGTAAESWLFFLPERREFDAIVPGDVEILHVCLEQDRLLGGARILNARFWDVPPNDLQVFSTPRRAEFESGIRSILALHRVTDDLPDALRGAVGTLLLDTILLAMNDAAQVIAGDTPEFRARRRDFQTVQNAREFIDTSLQRGHVPSVVEICAHACVSERTLQYAFQRQLQLSPLSYLRILRLGRVRTDLLAATARDASVTRIALRWGFVHLSKFAQDYRLAFGELPSETLAKGIARR